MKKGILLLVTAFLLCMPLAARAASHPSGPGPEDPAFTGTGYYERIRAFLDRTNDLMASLDLKFQDTRVSPIIRSDEWIEVPMEFGCMGTEDQLLPVLEKLSGYSFADSRCSLKALCISVSAENAPSGHPLLTVNLQCALVAGKGIATADWPLAFNRRLTRAMDALLRLTTFRPQIRKRVQGGGLEGGPTWVTNLRVDGDGRVQITGYGAGLDAKVVTALGSALLKSGAFLEVFLSNMSRNVYEKHPVWRFDLTGKLP